MHRVAASLQQLRVTSCLSFSSNGYRLACLPGSTADDSRCRPGRLSRRPPSRRARGPGRLRDVGRAHSHGRRRGSVWAARSGAAPRQRIAMAATVCALAAFGQLLGRESVEVLWQSEQRRVTRLYSSRLVGRGVVRSVEGGVGGSRRPEPAGRGRVDPAWATGSGSCGNGTAPTAAASAPRTALWRGAPRPPPRRTSDQGPATRARSRRAGAASSSYEYTSSRHSSAAARLVMKDASS